MNASTQIAGTQDNLPLFQTYCPEYANTQENWKCLIFEYFIQNLKVPVLFLNSPTDTWALQNLIPVTCWIKGLSTCSVSELKLINDYANRMIVLAETKVTNPVSRVFCDLCSDERV